MWFAVFFIFYALLVPASGLPITKQCKHKSIILPILQRKFCSWPRNNQFCLRRDESAFVTIVHGFQFYKFDDENIIFENLIKYMVAKLWKKCIFKYLWQRKKICVTITAVAKDNKNHTKFHSHKIHLQFVPYVAGWNCAVSFISPV